MKLLLQVTLLEISITSYSYPSVSHRVNRLRSVFELLQRNLETNSFIRKKQHGLLEILVAEQVAPRPNWSRRLEKNAAFLLAGDCAR